MSVFLPSHQISIAHSRRIDRIVCAMHQDRAARLAIEAAAGFPETWVNPVRVEIRGRVEGFGGRLIRVCLNKLVSFLTRKP
jgi:hypothetical protein